ncbi:hypothetical protein KNHN1_00070 [Pseudomonas guariconensis]|uniref:TniB family NTP-binding protein n=1 Tax=Pseudomonas guariconensis TaxID=1288410 RepID=UPI0036F43906
MNAIDLYECYEHGEYSFTLRDRFIHSPQVERALTRLGDIHGDSRRTRASKGLLIQGPSGVGKSTLVKEYIRSLEESESHDLRISRSSGHPFHEHLTTDSTVIRPPIPRASGH